MLQSDLYTTLTQKFNEPHPRVYTTNAGTSCWLITPMYGLAFLRTFTNSIKKMVASVEKDGETKMQQADRVSFVKLRSTCTFHLHLMGLINTVAGNAITQAKHSAQSQKQKFRKGYDYILSYAKDWLQAQSVDPDDGVYRDTNTGLHYMGFTQQAFREKLLQFETISHHHFQFCHCPNCGEPANDSLDLQTEPLTKIQKDFIGIFDVDHIREHKKHILCNDFTQKYFERSKCKNPELYKMFFKTPVKELVVSLERGLSPKFKISDLKNIPLVDFYCNEHQYECTHFVTYRPYHVTLHVIDWIHEIRWTLQSLEGSDMKQISLKELQKMLHQTKLLFLRKKSSGKSLSADTAHFKHIIYKESTLRDLLKV